MKRNILLAGQEIGYKHLKTRRAKRLIITVRHDATILVSTPHYYPIKFVEQSLRQRTDWVLQQIQRFKNSSNLAPAQINRDEFKRYQATAKVFVAEAIDRLNQVYHFPFNKISIKSQTTVWGSCSAKGNLNFNYQIIFLPPAVAEYIIVHELCHLQEMNHSKKFWQLVSRAVPEYQILRRQLKKITLA